MQKVIKEKFPTQKSRTSIWEFADTLERNLHQSRAGEQEVVVLGPTLDQQSKSIHEQLERFRRLNDARERKITTQAEKNASDEIKECTFKPSLNDNPLYSDTKSRYQHTRQYREKSSPPKREPLPDELFKSSLRQPQRSESRPFEEEFVVGLTPNTMSRLDEATQFFEIYREQMTLLREYHANLVKQDRVNS